MSPDQVWLMYKVPSCRLIRPPLVWLTSSSSFFHTYLPSEGDGRDGKLHHGQADGGGALETAPPHCFDFQHISTELTVQCYELHFESTSRPVGWHIELSLQSNLVWKERSKSTQRSSSVITHLIATRGSWVAAHSKMAVVPLMTRLSVGGLDMMVRPWDKHNNNVVHPLDHF